MRGRQRGSAKTSSRQVRSDAEQVAIAALGFIAAEPERLARFLAMTGIAPQSIRAAAREPDFLAGVLDHLAGDEQLLLSFGAEHQIEPTEVMRARDALAGAAWERELP